MEKHLRLLSEVSNERFIGPKQIIIDKDVAGRFVITSVNNKLGMLW